MTFAALAVKRPIATSVLFFAAMLLGLVALTRLEVTLLPEIAATELNVWVPYADAGVEQVEESVARPIEQAIVAVRGVRGVSTRVLPGGASVQVRLHPDADPELVALSVRERLDAVRWELPGGVGRPLLRTASGEEQASMVLALASSDLSGASDWARTVLKPRLEQIDGIARAQVVGAPRPEMHVTPDPARMAVHGVSASDLATALREANVEAPGGYVARRGIRYALSLETGLTDADEVGATIVRWAGARPLRVRDVARVETGFADPEGYSRLDGASAVGILLYREAGANLLRTTDRVHETLAQVRSEFPTLNVAVVTDPTPFVRQSISGVWQAVWLGGLLAFGILLFFLGDIRSPLFLGTSLPISVLPSFAILDLCGVSLNLMSLGGLALGVGMLVDNSVIALENIHRLQLEGKDRRTAAAEGAREMAMPIFASTLTTVAVFLPVSLVRGPIGSLLRDLSLSVCVSLGMSVLVSLTFLPMLVGRFGLPPSPVERRPLYGLYHRTLEACLARPRRFLGWVGAALAVSIAILAWLPREILPEVATREAELRLRLPSGHDIAATDAVVREIESWVATQPGVEQVFTLVGSASEIDLVSSERQPNYATLRIRMHANQMGQRDPIVRELLQRWNGMNGTEIEVAASRDEMMALLPSGESTLSCELRGADRAVADRLLESVQAEAERSLRADRASVDAGQPLRLQRGEVSPHYRMSLLSDALWRHELNETEVIDAVRARSGGLEATQLRRFDEEHAVVVREAIRPAPYEGSLVAGGRVFPVEELLSVQTAASPALVLREDQNRVVALRWDGPMREVGRVKRALERASAVVGLPPGYSLRFGGAWQEMQRTLGEVLRAFALSAGLVLLILAAQFESLTLPLLVFASVPLALVGVAIGLLLSGESISALAAVGLVILVGVVDNEAILKVEFLRQLRERGHSPREAVRIASRDRYRPILMTTVTNLLGLVPMYFGQGAELRAPMATVLIGGLTSGAILTLLVIPVLFDLLGGERTRGGGSWRDRFRLRAKGDLRCAP
ncbi:MAG: efflux RND transporter permease subunit [Candidatus Eisenbacteria bacterium]|nr:efflux RND transporter permease subunit [Candidatus Eisenbacteria bacterium]